MYSWPAYVMSAIVVEIPFNIVTGSIFFFCWYWTVGFPRESGRVGYAYLLYMLFELYYATFAQWVAALSPNPMSASILFSTFFSFVIIFNGVVVPTGKSHSFREVELVLTDSSKLAELPYFWRVWMHPLTPFTYLIEGLVANAVGGLQVQCSLKEFNFVTPPAGQECLAFLQPFTSTASGYAEVMNGACGYCPVSFAFPFSLLHFRFSFDVADSHFSISSRLEINS